MCTVTYLPTGKDQFILTSNRDEQPGRSPESIRLIQEADWLLAFPPDQPTGGAWIAAASDNRAVCLLNGAFVKHHHRPPYKRSRGTMVLEFFQYGSAENFFTTYDFVGMEPFTMVIYDRGQLFELRWDEVRTHVRPLDAAQTYLWSSSTLYDEEMQQKRLDWFEEWLDGQTGFAQEAILDFHHHAGDGNPWSDVIMNRNGVVRTVSITSIHKGNDKISIRYEDLLREKVKHLNIHVNNDPAGV